MRFPALLSLVLLTGLSLSAETNIVLNKVGASLGVDVQRVTVPAGDRVTLNVSVLSGNFWLKDGHPIPGASSQTLVLDAVTPSDSGLYYLSYAGNESNRSQGLVLQVTPAAQTGGHLETFSLRGVAGSGDQSLVGGFVVSASSGDPTATRRVLVRAVGPTLESFGVSGFLMHPELKVFGADGNAITPLSVDSLELAQAMLSTGSFPLKAGAGDQVALFALPAGAYSAQVSAPPAESGVVILDVYTVPSGPSPLSAAQ